MKVDVAWDDLIENPHYNGCALYYLDMDSHGRLAFPVKGAVSSDYPELMTFDDLCDILGLAEILEFEEEDYLNGLEIAIKISQKFNITMDKLETPNDWNFTKQDFPTLQDKFVKLFKVLCSKPPEEWV